MTDDISDPLSLLLHSDSASMDDSPADWSHFTAALWSNPQSTDMDHSDMLDYPASDQLADLSMNMDIHSFGIEPNMLHFDHKQQPFADMQYPYFPSSPGDILSNQFPFSFQAALDQIPPPDSSSSSSISSPSPSISSGSPQLSPSDSRRLSVASTPVIPEAKPQLTPQDPAEELAKRVRETAGVMLAVPMTAQLAGQVTTSVPAPCTYLSTSFEPAFYI